MFFIKRIIMYKTAVIVTVSELLFFTSWLSAQTIEPAQDQRISLAVEFLKPYFVDSNSSSASSAFFLSVRIGLSETMAIVGSLPFAYHSYEDDFGFEYLKSKTILGNPYLGFQFANRAATFFAELGTWLPLSTLRNETASSGFGASYVGAASDFDRFEAFVLYDFALTGRLNYRRELCRDLQLHIRGGLSGGIDTAQDGGVPNFTTLDYGTRLAYEVVKISIMAGVSGRYLLTGAAPFLFRFGPGRDRATHQLAIAVSADFGRVQPGFYFRAPVDKSLKDESRFVLGVNLGVRLK